MAHSESRRQTIMIAENDRTILELLQIRFDVAGYHTCMARTGPLTVQTLRNFRPAALVIDLNLPELNAFDVLREFNPRGEKLLFPILLMARKLGPEDIQQAVRLGVGGVMTKPFAGAEALERLERLLRKPTPQPARPPVVLNA